MASKVPYIVSSIIAAIVLLSYFSYISTIKYQSDVISGKEN